MEQAIYKSILWCVFVVGGLLPGLGFAIEPEDVLGEYWEDPLFGEAAAETVVQVELLHRLLWPKDIKVNVGKNVRFNVFNKTKELHVLVLTKEPEVLESDAYFEEFIGDEIAHASVSDGAAIGHHDHIVSHTDEALSLVRTLEQKPTVTVRPGEFKELTVRFAEPALVSMHCVIEGHEHLKHSSIISVEAQ